MIRNDNEHARAMERIEQEKVRLAATQENLQSKFTATEVERLMAPMRSFHQQLVEEVEAYERLKRGDLGDLTNLRGLGRLLIHLRISRGISQRDLAKTLGVHESQVSRDERNEYHGVTLERATKILDALGAKLLTSVVEPVAAARTEMPQSPKGQQSPKASLSSPDNRVTPPANAMSSGRVSDADFASAA